MHGFEGEVGVVTPQSTLTIPSGNIKPQFQYCDGWTDYSNMGISVICAVDLETDQEWAFVNDGVFDSKKQFQSLIYECLKREGEVAGFNSENFDDRVCGANGIAVTTTLDLLAEIRLAAFGSRDWRDTPQGFTYKLDAIAKANGYAKTGSGEIAPELWQMGKHQEVIDYCMNDVRITKELLLKFLGNTLVDPNTNLVLQYNK